MKKLLAIFCTLFLVTSFTVLALSDTFNFNSSLLSFAKNSKKEKVLENFDQEYSLSYSMISEKSELENEIIELSKKSTYLLFGEVNGAVETNEEYYMRYKAWASLRYAPSIPKTEDGSLDTNSKEYSDNLVSGVVIRSIFSQASELGLIYNSYGDINVIFTDDMALSMVYLPKVKVKTQSKDNPLDYVYVETDYVMYYFYKKLDNEWKIYYIYGETTDEISDYVNDIENVEISGQMKIIPSYDSELRNIYDFEELDNLSQNVLDSIYDKSINNLVFISGHYSNSITGSANGFFINDSLIVTTWHFLEQSLINSQFITITDNNSNNYELEGIVTVNPSTDIAVFKVKNSKNVDVTLGESETLEIGNPIMLISSKIGNNFSIQSGIMISNEDYLQTSMPISQVDEGSPLLNRNGEIVGMVSSKLINSSTSLGINSEVLKEIKEKFALVNTEDIKAVSFEDLKEKYYYVNMNEEKLFESVSDSVWKKYSKIGNVSEEIKLDLIKSSYKDGILSLRYKNNLNELVSGIVLTSSFQEELVKEGFVNILTSDKKVVYENKEYQVIIMEEFDYLIVVMVKL